MDQLPGPGIPIEAGKGYSFAVRPTVMPRHAVLLTDVHVGCTPFTDFLRIGGNMEFNGANRNSGHHPPQTTLTSARPPPPPFSHPDITPLCSSPRRPAGGQAAWGWRPTPGK